MNFQIVNIINYNIFVWIYMCKKKIPKESLNTLKALKPPADNIMPIK